MTMRRLSTGILALLLLSGPCLPAQARKMRHIVPNARDFYRYANNFTKGFGESTGEDFCWRAAANLEAFYKAYYVWKSRTWLDYAVKYYDEVLEKSVVGPDGYRGWIGPYLFQKPLQTDTHIGDGIIAKGLLGFSEIVLSSDRYKEIYGKEAQAYVDYVEKHVIEKWDKRGTWIEDGPYGYYKTWDWFKDPGKSDWSRRPSVTYANMSYAFNKQETLGIVALRLWRITGKEQYRERAERIFRLVKSRFQLIDGYYVWNFWEPLGPQDYDHERGIPTHWIDVHPWRSYQNYEVKKIVEAYLYGIVFTEEDIKRLLKTNLEVMWNGDIEEPHFRNSNALIPGLKQGKRRTEYADRGGSLWVGLGSFDERIRKIEGKRSSFPNNTSGFIDKDFFERHVWKEEPGFQRRVPKDQWRLFEFPFHDSPALYFAAAVPARLPAESTMLILSGSHVAGDLEIGLWSSDGKDQVATLRKRHLQIYPKKGERQGHHLLQWDGRHPETGERLHGKFRIRWTFRKTMREQPITLD